MLTIKSDAVHSHIAMQFEKDPSRREYLAVVEGELMLDSDEISLPIARHMIDSQKNGSKARYWERSRVHL